MPYRHSDPGLFSTLLSNIVGRVIKIHSSHHWNRSLAYVFVDIPEHTVLCDKLFYTVLKYLTHEKQKNYLRTVNCIIL